MNKGVIYDVIYGFVPITEWEEKIINSPFFQRLRWIRQLGFSSYIFPGAEHNRFSHVIGVMHSMEQMIRALGIAVPDEQLFSRRSKNPNAMLHKSLRIAALLHDIGTFPFSHAIEYAYIRHGNPNSQPKPNKKDLPNSHEHLGSYIIKNTDYPGGITEILNAYGFDVQLISDIIKGDSPHLIANQLMHSDLDADRMDYLIRDSHYTGIKYGQFDRDFVLANLTTFQAGKKQLAFGIRDSAIHAVEDFLISRFNWYSQIIKNPGSAKFDIVGTFLAKNLLETNLMYQFHDLLSMIDNRGERFFWWNDNYFISRCQEIRYNNLLKDTQASELNEMLLFRKPPKTLKLDSLEARILHEKRGDKERRRYIREIEKQVREFKELFDRHGTGDEWILADIPTKDVVFTSGTDEEGKSKPRSLDRDPIRVIKKNGTPVLLKDCPNSLMQHFSGISNFVPSVYVNESAYDLLIKKKAI